MCFSLDLKRHFLTEGFYPSDLFDSRGLIDDITDFDGATATEVNAEMLVRVTQDDPSGSPTYSDFQTFANGTYKGRGFQFRAKLTSNDTAQDIRVSQLGYTASLQRRTEQGNLTASGAGAKAVTFTHPFFTGTSALLGANSNLPSIGINAQNMASGDYFEVSPVSLERVLLFTLKTHQMLRLIGILLIRLSDLVKEGRIGTMLLV